MKQRGWIMIVFVCFLFSGCATVTLKENLRKTLVQPYQEEFQDFKENALRIDLAPAITGQPEAIGLSKAYDLASLVVAPVLRPLDQKVLNPYVRQPINFVTKKFVIQPLLIKPAGWIGKKIGLIKEKPTSRQFKWFENNPMFSFWNGYLKIDEASLLSEFSLTESPEPVSMISMPKPDIHIVAKGECLWKIAEKHYGQGNLYKKIVKVNNIKSPYLIFPNQVLLIPELEWKKVGGNPFKGSWQWAIENFDLLEDIKLRVKRNIKEENYKLYILKSGQRANQVIFGQNKIWQDVLCNWPKDQLYLAKDYGTSGYRVIKVIKCKNWAWWIESVKEPPAKPTRLVVKKPEEKPVLPLGKLVRQGRWYLDYKHWESSSGGFMERFEDKTDVYGRWHVFYYFPLVYQDAKGRKHQFGLAAENIFWKGSTRDRFAFEGGKNLMIGPAYKLNTLQSETYFRLTYGRRDDKGFIHSHRTTEDGQRVTEKYKMKQHSDILSFYASHERWSQRKWFGEIRFYGLFDVDLGNSKHAKWRGYDEESGRFKTKRISSRADEKDLYSGGFWLDIYDYREGLLRPQFGFELKHYTEGHKTGLRPGFGISFFSDAFFIGTNYTFWNKHYANSWGLECWIDFWKLYIHFFKRGKDIIRLYGPMELLNEGR